MTKLAKTVALLLLMSAGAAMAAAGGNGKVNNGAGASNGAGKGTGAVANGGANNGKGKGGGSTPVIAAACAASDISIVGASCIGFIDGNLNGNSPSLTAINSNLGVWGVHLTAPVAAASMLSGLNGTTINFGQQLYGETIVGMHYGNVIDALGNKSNDVTAFYRFNAGNGIGVDLFTTKYGSLSNATLYSTGHAPVVAAVPEPGTYAMLLAGLGLMGFVARRRQQK